MVDYFVICRCGMPVPFQKAYIPVERCWYCHEESERGEAADSTTYEETQETKGEKGASEGKSGTS